MNNWETIKDKVYYVDGSLRDIYVLGTDRNDWRMWSNLINKKYQVTFYNGRTRRSSNNIDIDEIFKFWDGCAESVDPNIATIKLRDVKIMCYFFTEEEIENDIDPKEVNAIEDHEVIVDYLTSVSQQLMKKVILTSEDTEDDILYEINTYVQH